jgi:hypothetical protein
MLSATSYTTCFRTQGGAKSQKEPANLFISCVPDDQKEAFMENQHTIRPDLIASTYSNAWSLTTKERIYDVKNLFSFDLHYPNNGRRSAVNAKETQTIKEYTSKARKLDNKFNPHAGKPGPIEQKLLSYENVTPLVFGVFSEANKAVEELVDSLSKTKAHRVAERYTRRSNFSNSVDIDTNALAARFKMTYMRVLSTWVGYQKADLLIKRKCLIGLTPDQQRASLNSVNSRARPHGGFGQDFFGPEQGSHFYGSNGAARGG